MSQKWWLRGAFAAALALACWLGWQQVRPAPRTGDAPYVPTPLPVVDRMLELAAVGAGDMLYDLGSGDGRIVIRAAERFGARARGFELDALLVRESRAAAAVAGVGDRVEIVHGDLFDADLAEATAVTLFLLPSVNLALRPRLLSELAPGTPVVSHMWDMGVWRADVREVVPHDPPAELYAWIVPAALGGVWDVRLGEGATAGTITLRMLQRFQQVEGELVHDGRRVPLTGELRGAAARVATTRPDAELGMISMHGTVAGDELDGELTSGRSRDTLPFVARRRAATVSGVWRLGAPAEPFVPQWSVRLRRAGARWTATRATLDTGGSAAVRGTLPGGLPGTAGSGVGEEAMSEVHVWGASVAFFVGAADGSARTVAYYGLVEGNRMTGVAHDGGTLVPWVARRDDQRP